MRKPEVSKINIVFVIFVLLFALLDQPVFCQTSGESCYFPLNVGNKWVFEADAYADTDKVVSKQIINGKIYYGIETDYSSEMLWFRQDNGKVYIAETLDIRPETADVEEQLIYDFSADNGDSWKLKLNPRINCYFGGTITLEDKDDIVHTRLGTYSKCYKFSRQTGCSDIGRIYEWFAPGIGRISYVQDSYGGGFLFIITMSNILTKINKEEYISRENSSRNLLNYPNPFNPSTIIMYELPNNNFVNLAVYDLLGRKVAELVNQYQTAGKHEIKFSPHNLSDGVYIYALTADKYVERGKMIYLK